MTTIKKRRAVLQRLAAALAQWDRNCEKGAAERAYRGMEIAEAARTVLGTLIVDWSDSDDDDQE